MRYFIRLSYNGAPFSGWQIQKNATGVQEELQKAFSLLLKEKIEITGAGRTDSGVNAVNYIAHTDIQSQTALSGKSQKQFLYKLNAILPPQIRVEGIYKMHPEAHARFDATSRTYNYFISTEPSPFDDRFTFYVKCKNLNIEAMNKAAKFFIGTKDFASLQKVGSDNKTSVCTVTEAVWKRAPLPAPFNAGCRGKRYVFTVTANRFLRNMVRAMVGSLLEVGLGKREPEWIEEMLKKKNRSSAAQSVAGNALFLTRITYPYPIK
ncbi:MAG: tRNA pseudouridine(38-40) synthase TruA [Bacteroidales bacterium]|nr:tRNA pseudouridine(38-40) synthase TruA [Bacteroidales bacterium]